MYNNLVVNILRFINVMFKHLPKSIKDFKGGGDKMSPSSVPECNSAISSYDMALTTDPTPSFPVFCRQVLLASAGCLSAGNPTRQTPT